MTEVVEKSLLWGEGRVMVSLILVTLVALYFYLMSNMDYWKKRGFPELPAAPIPFLGHTFKLMIGQVNFSHMFVELYKAAGDQPFVGFFQGTKPCLLVKDTELIKHILIKDFHVFMDRGFQLDEEIDPLNAKALSNLQGQRWKSMRARLSPTFTSGRMKAMFPLMHGCSDELIKSMKMDIEKNHGEATIEIKEYLASFSIDVIATCAFGIQCDALQNPETSEFRRMGKLTFQATWKRTLLLGLLLSSPKLLKKLGLKFTMEESNVFFRNFVKDMMEKREAAIDKGEGSGYGDFIHHLVLLKKKGLQKQEQKDDDDDEDNEFLKSDKVDDQSWTNVDLDDFAAQAMIFFSAGFETTSNLLSFALFELTSSESGKEIQNRIREEVDKVMEEDGGKITYEGLKRMHLVDRVLNESLRLYPPAGLLSRVTLQSYTIPGTNLRLDKGIHVFISTQALQQDDKIFPNAMKFDPDRFLPELKDQWNQFAYLPFGDGPRLCIGQRFALMQARLAMATLISRFKFELSFDKTPVPLKFKKRAFIMTAESGIWLKAKLRDETK